MTDESINNRGASYAGPPEASTGALRVAILGLGRAGTAVLRECLAAPGISVVGAWNRSPRPLALPCPVTIGGEPPDELLGADLVLLAVLDDAVPAVARGLRVPAATAVVHLSGAADASLLDSLPSGHRGCWHPLQAFAERPPGGMPVPPYAVALQGDPVAVQRGRALADALGHPAVELAADGRAAYHAAAVLASNCLVALEATALRVMGRAGVSPDDGWKLLWPLVAGTLANLEAGPAPSALTGPVARGDARTIERNLSAIGADSGARDAYVALSNEALALARAAGVDPDRIDAIAQILACDPARSAQVPDPSATGPDDPPSAAHTGDL